ncbi:hypothetical protein BaRGS_00035753 [Batillaria attramentaria]|uniref:TauD/TfdA-like domain-containing protein n=1 Tax=Batillaria attramentaria TaxID=370345 RepID=A0ABD0JD44_9CAEN
MPEVNVTEMVQEVQLPEQKEFDGRLFPLALGAVALQDMTSTLQWAHNQQTTIDQLLLENGAIVFRGLPIKDPADFDSFVKAFGGEPLEYVGGAAPRRVVVGNVFTANEAPPDQLIPFHHEMAQVPTFPSRLFFYCDVAPPSGGQTPLALSHVVYRRMQERHPDFVHKLEQEGVRYTRVLPDGDDPTSPIGRGWQSTFQTEDKAEAERKAAAQGTSTEWLPNGCLKTITKVLPAVRVEERTGRKTWFNSVIAAYRGWRDSRNCAEKAVTFGDGSPMPPDVMDSLDEVFRDVAVAVTWQKGDVIVVDNRLVLHSRRSFTPPRRILAALVK